MKDAGGNFWDDESPRPQADAAESHPQSKRSSGAIRLVTILFAVVGVTLGLMWVWNEQSTMRIHVVFADGGGLGVDSPVYVRGMRVGRVSHLKFETTGKIRATLSVRRDAADHLHDHTLFFATREQFLTGPACVAVYNPIDGSGRRLRSGDTVTAVSGLPETVLRIVLPQIGDMAAESQSQLRRMSPFPTGR